MSVKKNLATLVVEKEYMVMNYHEKVEELLRGIYAGLKKEPKDCLYYEVIVTDHYHILVMEEVIKLYKEAGWKEVNIHSTCASKIDKTIIEKDITLIQLKM
jgi:hypothetical protein